MLAAIAGVMRRVENLKNGVADKDEAIDQERYWDYDISGCIGEYVVCKYLRVPWDGKGKLGAEDVDGRIQVRTSPVLIESLDDEHPHPRRHLILFHKDKEHLPFWFVTGVRLHYFVHGWVMGRDGKQQKYWRSLDGRHKPTFNVPMEALHQVYDKKEGAPSGAPSS